MDEFQDILSKKETKDSQKSKQIEESFEDFNIEDFLDKIGEKGFEILNAEVERYLRNESGIYEEYTTDEEGNEFLTLEYEKAKWEAFHKVLNDKKMRNKVLKNIIICK